MGDVVRLSGTSYIKAQANTEANAEAVGIVSEVAGPDDFTLCVSGHITTLSGLTAGAVYYLDDDTAGLLTTTEPLDAGDVSKPLLIAASTTSGWIFNMRGFITSSGGNDGTDGWIDDTAATWTRTADQTFTVTGDRTLVFSKGTRLKWTQTSVKYGVVIGSSFGGGTTTVTIATTTDYVLTAAAISNNYYSYATEPQGYPDNFAYTPSWTGTGNPAIGDGSLTGKFSVIGDLCWCQVAMTAGGSTTFGSSTWTVSYPIAELGSSFAAGPSIGTDGTNVYPGFWRAGSVLQLATVPATFWSNTIPFSWGSGDGFVLNHCYRY